MKCSRVMTSDSHNFKNLTAQEEEAGRRKSCCSLRNCRNGLRRSLLFVFSYFEFSAFNMYFIFINRTIFSVEKFESTKSKQYVDEQFFATVIASKFSVDFVAAYYVLDVFFRSIGVSVTVRSELLRCVQLMKIMV